VAKEERNALIKDLTPWLVRRKHVEGKRILEPVKSTLADTLREMEEDIQSAISYAGGKKLMDIRKVNYEKAPGSGLSISHSSLPPEKAPGSGLSISHSSLPPAPNSIAA